MLHAPEDYNARILQSAHEICMHSASNWFRFGIFNRINADDLHNNLDNTSINPLPVPVFFFQFRFEIRHDWTFLTNCVYTIQLSKTPVRECDSGV